MEGLAADLRELQQYRAKYGPLEPSSVYESEDDFETV